MDQRQVQKRSGLLPRAYAKHAAALQQQLAQTGDAVTTAEAMGRFYGQPALQGVLEGLLGELLGGTAAEHAGHAGEWLVAGLHAISQRAVPRARWGTLAELAAQWAVTGDAVRQLQARPELRTAVAQAVPQPQALGAQLGRAAGAGAVPRGAGRRRRAQDAAQDSAFAWPVHPLALFSCAPAGPAFGSLLFS